MQKLVRLCLLLILFSGVTLLISAQDNGESKENTALRNRSAVPKEADMDKSVTLAGLLTKTGEKDWNQSKAATVEGKVVQVEREEDGDIHLVLAPAGGETDTTKWVITEVTAKWARKNKDWNEKKLKAMVGKSVRVTGWLYYEPDTDYKDPRGTRWELHPVTALTVIP